MKDTSDEIAGMVEALSTPPEQLSPKAEEAILKSLLESPKPEAHTQASLQPLRLLDRGWPKSLLALAAAVLLLLAIRPWRKPVETIEPPSPTFQARILERQGAAAIGALDLTSSIKIPERSTVTAALAPGLLIRFREKTEAAPLLLQDGRYVLKLQHGTIDARYDRASSDPLLRVQTPQGIIDVTGTTFHVAVDSALSVAVTRGAVQIVRNAKRVRVSQGEQFVDRIVDRLRIGVRLDEATIEAWAVRAGALKLDQPKKTQGFLALHGDLPLFEAIDVDGQPVTALPALVAREVGTSVVNLHFSDGTLRTLRPTIEAGKTLRLALKPPTPQAKVEPVPAPKPMERPQKAPARSQLDEIYARAETHLAKGEHRKAIQDLERITKIDPRGPTGALAFFELGRLHREAGKLKKAEAAFRRAVHAGLSEPLLSRARLGMCAIAIRRQDSQRARACLSLIQSSPSKSTAARAAVLEAQVACMDGRFDIAERRFFRAMELSPPGARIDVEVRLGRVRCAIQQGALHRAETLLQGLKKSTRAHRTERRELEVIILREKKRKK